MADGLYYKHSGAFTLQGIVLGILVGLAAGIPLAFAYAYLILYIPLVGYITFLFSAAFGALVGIATTMGLKWRKVRNVPVAFAAAAVTSLVAFYASWSAWIYALLRRANMDVELTPILFQPDVLWQLIVRVNGVGAYTIRSWTPTGTALWIFWSLEALLIVGLALLLAVKFMRDEPFCEACGNWCKGQEGIARVASGDTAELKQRLEAKDLTILQNLGAAPAGAAEWFRLDLHACPSCKMTNTLSVKTVKLKIDKQGKSEESAEDTIDMLLLGPTETELVRRLGEKQTGAAAAAGA